MFQSGGVFYDRPPIYFVFWSKLTTYGPDNYDIFCLSLRIFKRL